MRVIFAGTPDFAVPALEALAAAGHSIVLVLTQPDRPAGRGLASRPSPVKSAALRAGFEVFQPPSLKDALVQERLRAAGADVMIVAAYGLILPQAVLDICPRGAINIHASLLPRWRGAAPIQRAILAGDARTGVCIMRMEAGLDTGPVYSCGEVPIDGADTAGTLHDKLAACGAELLVRALAEFAAGRAHAQPQPEAGVTYAAKIDKAEAAIDWTAAAATIALKVRAFNPVPGATARAGGDDYKIWNATARPAPNEAAAGTVTAVGPDGIAIRCGEGELLVTAIQRAGAKRLDLAQFVRGTTLVPGACFESVRESVRP